MTGRRRGFSLLEILIAVSLLLGLAALSMPVLLPRLAERTFETAADVVEQQLLLARATAQSTGHPVEVRYHAAEDTLLTGASPVPPRVEARWFDDGTAVDPDADGARVPGALVPDGWAYRPLSRGVRLSRRRPEPVWDGSGFDDPFDDGPAFEPGPPDETPLGRLAVFLPDGSVLMGVTVWIVDDDGRAGVIEIDPWLGTPTFTRAADVPDEDETDAEEEERERDEANADERRRRDDREADPEEARP